MQTACIDGDFELHPSSKVLRVHFAFSWSFNSSFLTFSRAANNSFFSSALWLNLILVPIYESQSTSQHYDSFIGTGGSLFYPEVAVKETLARDLETFLSGNSKARFSGYFSHSHDKSAFSSGFHHVKNVFLSGF